MQIYTAPLRDMRFVLHELHGLDALTRHERFADFTADVVDSVLEEAGKIASEVLLPLNAVGDQEGCVLENGVVRTPTGFKAAYTLFREGGWTALAAPPEWGGQGAPESVSKMVEEMMSAANSAFGLFPGLTGGAIHAIADHATDDLKQAYLPKMIDGTWTGAMALTESQCGTDLGLLRTRAVPNDDGSYRLDGSKIFISAGEHDLTENIVHLVLARLPDAPPGVKGISLFLVPKFLPSADGTLGPRNGVLCTGLEHKMGMKASPTCQLTFEDAKGWLVGQPHKGMAAMFTMMNVERLGVGMQGLGATEASYQSAAAYAKDRLQGRSLSGAKRPDLPADPIIVHPDVRRMLMTMRVYAEGCRAVGGWVSQAIDVATAADDPALKQQMDDFVALMTPVVKALFTDLGSEAANLGVQVYGGHGYIREHGMEQYVRDARIAQIYEGANGIQALDLVGRKMGANFGRSLRNVFHPMAEFIDANRDDPEIGKLVGKFEKAFGALQLATANLAQAALRDPEEAGAASVDYLRLLGLTAMGFMFVRSAKIAAEKAPTANGDASFYKAKRISADFFVDRVLPETTGLFLKLKAGKAAMMAMPEDLF
jgi:alkylation response protein AidB-like acyl-CoA dehydrogenase